MADKLSSAIAYLQSWQRSHKGHTASRCLEAVRLSLSQAGITLPPPLAAPRNTAIANYNELAKDPAKYGFKRSHSPLDPDKVYLMYFKNCGWVGTGKNRRAAGHIALKHGNWLYANQNYKWNQYWADRTVGAFVVDD